MKILSSLLSLAFFAPVLALAATSNAFNLEAFSFSIANIVAFINSVLVPAIFTLAFLVFLWGMFKTFILGGHDEEAQSQGKQLMMYAIAGFVIMVSLWGIVNLVASGFGFTGENLQAIPRGPMPGTPSTN